MNTRGEPPGAERSTDGHASRIDLRGGRIHVWHGSLDTIPEPVTAGESARARAMRSAHRRHEFLVCRGALRRILGGALGIDPLAVPIHEGAHGKPFVAQTGASSRTLPALGFNVSHSGERYVIALALGLEPGVDVERIRPRARLDRLMRRFFSPAEQRAVGADPEPLLAFHRVWARKEAVIKADGRGVSLGLGRFDVSAGEPPALLEARWDGAEPGEAAGWTLHTLRTDPGYAAALAVRCAGAEVVVRAGGPGAGPDSDPSPAARATTTTATATVG